MMVKRILVPLGEYATSLHSLKYAIDLTTMGRRGNSLPKEVFFGSTANFVIHKSKVPVLVTR